MIEYSARFPSNRIENASCKSDYAADYQRPSKKGLYERPVTFASVSIITHHSVGVKESNDASKKAQNYWSPSPHLSRHVIGYLVQRNL